jgi:hypothetical protein
VEAVLTSGIAPFKPEGLRLSVRLQGFNDKYLLHNSHQFHSDIGYAEDAIVWKLRNKQGELMNYEVVLFRYPRLNSILKQNCLRRLVIGVLPDVELSLIRSVPHAVQSIPEEVAEESEFLTPLTYDSEEDVEGEKQLASLRAIDCI